MKPLNNRSLQTKKSLNFVNLRPIDEGQRCRNNIVYFLFLQAKKSLNFVNLRPIDKGQRCRNNIVYFLFYVSLIWSYFSADFK